MATNTNALYDPHERIHALATTDRPPSRNLIISPNLVAALEFDERIRRSSSPTPPSASGLPPPPRARKPTNPAVRIQQKLTSATLPTSSSQPLQHIPSNLPSNPSAWNPYINPKPFFPDLMSDEPTPRVVPASAPSSPVAPATYTFTPLRAPSFGAQQGSSFAAHRAHRRYLSALPKVEWNFFGKSVGSNGKKIENLIVDDRHGSSGGSVSSAGPDMRERQHKRVMTVTGSVMATTTSTSSACFPCFRRIEAELNDFLMLFSFAFFFDLFWCLIAQVRLRAAEMGVERACRWRARRANQA